MRFNLTLGIEESLKKIFGGILIGAIRADNPDIKEIVRLAKINRSRFLANFLSNVFQDEYAIFYAIIKMNVIVFSLDELNTIIDNNRDLVLDSPYVDLSVFSSTSIDTVATDDEKLDAFKVQLRELYIQLSNMLVGEDEYNSSCTVFINWVKNQIMLQTSQNMTRIMSDTGYEERLPGRRVRKYSGCEDAKRYYNERLRLINELDGKNRIRTVVINEDWYEEETQKEQSPDTEVLMTTGIQEIDGALGGLRRSNMMGILGPTKGGKTKFTNYLVARALDMGLNVCVWTLEGTSEEWTSMQTAAFIRKKNNLSLNSNDILFRHYTSDSKQRQIVNAAKARIALDPKRGRLTFIESGAYVEDFLNILEDHYERFNPFDVLVIDQLIDILSRNNMGKVERISQAYQELKPFLKSGLRRPILAIIPSQLKQTTVDFLRKNPNETIDITAGGESSEVTRSPDMIIGLFSSKEERQAGIMNFYDVASRHASNFPDFKARIELGCCWFESDPSLN